MLKRYLWCKLFVSLGIVLLVGQGTASAECGTCQVCKERTRLTIAADYCAVASGEAGYMCCTPETYGPATYCRLDGAACYGINVGGGGGGTGGGGGGNCSYQNGWCPAECFSCSGGTY